MISDRPQIDDMKVSIVIPLFNRERLIVDAIDSIMKQSHENFECIIIDDHSTDESFDKARKYTEQDDRFIVRKRSSAIKGAPACRNEGVAMAAGDYLMFLDSDDLLSEKCLEERLALYQVYPDKDFIVTQIGIFKEENGKATHYWNNLQGSDDIVNFLQGNSWQTSSTFFRTEFVRQFRYDEEASSWQDMEFHLRVLLRQPDYVKIMDNEPHVLIRRDDNRTGMKATNKESYFKSVEMRFLLMGKIESEMSAEQKKKYEKHLRMFYLFYLETFAVTNDSPDHLEELLKLHAKSFSYRRSSILSGLFKCYLKMDNNIFIRVFRRGMRLAVPIRPLKSRAVPIRDQNER